MATVLQGSQRKGPMARVEGSCQAPEPQTRPGGKVQGRQHQFSTLSSHENPGPLRSHATGGTWPPVGIYRGLRWYVQFYVYYRTC